MQDKVEKINGATVQHGPLGRRIYLMDLGSADPAGLIPVLERISREHGYTKIFAKVPSTAVGPFLEGGYEKEASVPGFYNGREEAVFLGRFLSPGRKDDPAADTLDYILRSTGETRPERKLPEAIMPWAKIRLCSPSDAADMARIYREVFPTYPFPVESPEYLIETMRSHVAYFCVECGGKIAALSSAEMDKPHENAEMTDFATLPAWRGNSLAFHLLMAMEEKVREWGFRTAYTIARAVSPAMNITFSNARYSYAGRLVNNTNISGQIESMNVWYKKLL